MRNIKLTIEYDGTKYYGWQKQKNMVTIQETIEETIKDVTKEDVQLIGSSRTDAGVHARGFVANFKTTSTIPSDRFREALNVKLPNDIVIVKSEEVEDSFHSRYNAKGKTYSYRLINRRYPVAINKDFVHQVKEDIDLNKMMEACKYFEGTHDFKAFKSSGSSVKTSIRTIYSLKIVKEQEIIKVVVSGDGFLYNMVRIIVGTLLEVGKNKIKPEDVQYIIQNGDRKKAGICVPARGLMLEEVFY